MDMELFASVAPVTWVADRFAPQDCKPRHIGRVVTADIMLSADPHDYASERLVGTLEAVVGDDLIVSGEAYAYSSLSNVRIYRREIKK